MTIFKDKVIKVKTIEKFLILEEAALPAPKIKRKAESFFSRFLEEINVNGRI